MICYMIQNYYSDIMLPVTIMVFSILTALTPLMALGKEPIVSQLLTPLESISVEERSSVPVYPPVTRYT